MEDNPILSTRAAKTLLAQNATTDDILAAHKAGCNLWAYGFLRMAEIPHAEVVEAQTRFKALKAYTYFRLIEERTHFEVMIWAAAVDGMRKIKEPQSLG